MEVVYTSAYTKVSKIIIRLNLGVVGASSYPSQRFHVLEYADIAYMEFCQANVYLQQVVSMYLPTLTFLVAVKFPGSSRSPFVRRESLRQNIPYLSDKLEDHSAFWLPEMFIVKSSAVVFLGVTTWNTSMIPTLAGLFADTSQYDGSQHQMPGALSAASQFLQ